MGYLQISWVGMPWQKICSFDNVHDVVRHTVPGMARLPSPGIRDSLYFGTALANRVLAVSESKTQRKKISTYLGKGDGQSTVLTRAVRSCHFWILTSLRLETGATITGWAVPQHVAIAYRAYETLPSFLCQYVLVHHDVPPWTAWINEHAVVRCTVLGMVFCQVSGSVLHRGTIFRQ